MIESDLIAKLSTIATGSIAAVVSFVPVSAMGATCDRRRCPPCLTSDIVAVVGELRRVAAGPIVLAFVDKASVEKWTDALRQQSLAFTSAKYIRGLIDVVIVGADSIELPPADVSSLYVLFQLLIEAISKNGDTVLNPFDTVEIINRAARSTDRQLVRILPANIAARSEIRIPKSQTPPRENARKIHVRQEQRLKVFELYGLGDTVKAISEKSGCSVSVVYRVIAEGRASGVLVKRPVTRSAAHLITRYQRIPQQAAATPEMAGLVGYAPVFP